MALIYDKEVKIYRTLCGSDNNNAYLMVCPVTMESVIVDAPLDPGRMLEEARGTQVKMILITHRHRDHWEGLKGKSRTPRARRWAPIPRTPSTSQYHRTS